MKNFSEKFVGKSPTFLSVLEKASCVRGRNANILITGKSGTGKELLARFIYELEENPSRAFVAVNCAAIPENLIESELFGHEKGAFTGAIERKIGKFELANGGDIFLDEISTLKPELQAKLLRVLQEKTVCRVGGNTPIILNFRVIAATNENLSNMVKAGTFREDLYHRLAIMHLPLPSLKERQEDIPLLAEHFLAKHSRADEKKIISKEVMNFFHAHEWTGNVRELENLIHSLIIMSHHKETIGTEDLNHCLVEKNITAHQTRAEVIDAHSESHEIQSLDHFMKSTRQDYIIKTLNTTNWNYTKASEKLQINRTTLYKYLEEMKLEEITLDRT